MSHYIFEASAQCLTYTPTSLDGDVIGQDVDEIPLAALDAVQVRLMERTKILPDRLSVGIKRFIVMRSYVAELLLARHAFPVDLTRVPAIVKDPSGRKIIADDFVLLSSNCEYDVLNRARSQYTSVPRMDGSEVVVSVKRWCIDPRAVPEMDAFPVEPNDWMVSEAFKWTYESEGFTGAVFDAVEYGTRNG